MNTNFLYQDIDRQNYMSFLIYLSDYRVNVYIIKRKNDGIMIYY